MEANDFLVEEEEEEGEAAAEAGAAREVRRGAKPPRGTQSYLISPMTSRRSKLTIHSDMLTDKGGGGGNRFTDGGDCLSVEEAAAAEAVGRTAFMHHSEGMFMQML